MARPRKELHQILVDILGSNHVFFQPPESIKLIYPCIIYRRVKNKIEHADNADHIHYRQYEGLVIDKNPDSEIPDRLEKLQYCSLDKIYTADNLNHYAFTIFF